MKQSVGERAWIVLGLGVLAYEVAAPEEQLLSEAVDRLLVKHPVATRVVVVGLALHLLNILPNQYDPLHHIAVTVRGRIPRTRSVADPRDQGTNPWVHTARKRPVIHS